jgi:uncharacterized protein (TIGR03000 family)
VALTLTPASSQAQIRIREGVYYYPRSTETSVQDNPALPPSTKALGDNPSPPYYPPTYYQVPTSFNRPTYMTSINYPWLYGGHYYMGGTMGSAERESFPVNYRHNRSTFNPDAPLPASSSLVSVSGVNGFETTLTAALADRAIIDVHVPADAEVRFQGLLMTQPGSVRRFYSPPLSPDLRYEYQVRAMWTQNGRPVAVTRTIPVRAGEHIDVNLEASSSEMQPTLRTRELPLPTKRD